MAALAMSPVPELDAMTQTEDEARDRAILRFLIIPDDELPKDVQLRKKTNTGTFVRLPRNPAIVTDRRQLDFMAKFFGVVNKVELGSILVGAVAMYESKTTEKEIGIYGIYYPDQKSADERFKTILTRASKRATKNKERVFPYIQQGRWLLFAWNDAKVSNRDFKAMLKYLQAERFKDRD
jgi:hypothetical protein